MVDERETTTHENTTRGTVRRARGWVVVLGVLARVLAWGAGGAVVTVLVAWGCAWNDSAVGPVGGSRWTDPDGNHYRLMVFEPGFGVERSFFTAFGYTRPELITLDNDDGPPIPSAGPPDRPPLPLCMFKDLLTYEGHERIDELENFGYRDILMSGWPMKAVWGGYNDFAFARVKDSPELWVWTLLVTVDTYCRRAVRGRLPIRPLPIGFALDTAVYGGFLWGVVALAGWVRRARRRRNSRCVACGYLLVGLPGGAACPECGRGVDGDA
ncbi:MAG: hypothetical protein AB7Q00_02215 [Phycisphaerales bacterium]